MVRHKGFYKFKKKKPQEYDQKDETHDSGELLKTSWTTQQVNQLYVLPAMLSPEPQGTKQKGQDPYLKYWRKTKKSDENTENLGPDIPGQKVLLSIVQEFSKIKGLDINSGIQKSDEDIKIRLGAGIHVKNCSRIAKDWRCSDKLHLLCISFCITVSPHSSFLCHLENT